MLQIHALLSMQAFSFTGLEKSLAGTSVLSLIWCGILVLLMLAIAMTWLIHTLRLQQSAKADRDFTASFRGSAHLLALFQTGMAFPESARAAVYKNACRELSWHLLGTDTVDKNYMARLRTAGRITPSQAEAVQRTSQHVTDEVTRPLVDGFDAMWVWSIPVVGFIGSLVCMLDGLSREEMGVNLWSPVLWPVVLSLVFFLLATLFRKSIQNQSRKVVTRVRDFTVEIGVALDRMFVDHRQPMEPLPSLGGMGLVEGPNFNQPPAETAPAPVTQRSVSV